MIHNNSSSITILHLSDLHFKEKDSYERDLALKSLIDAVEKYRNQKDNPYYPDLIVVTGDVAYSGHHSQYTIASEFFDDLLKAAAVSKEHLFIIPGNHDVDCDEGMGLIKTLDHDGDASRFFNAPKIHHFKKFTNFSSWHNDYFNGIRTFSLQSTCQEPDFVRINNLDIGLIRINSALFCMGRSDEEYKKLWINRQYLDEAIRQLDKHSPNLRLVLLHHPLDWLHDSERDKIKSILQSKADLLLTGHLHHLDAFYREVPAQGSLIHLAAGATYDLEKRAMRVSYVGIDYTKSEVRVFPIRYIDTPRPAWPVDSSINPFGLRHEVVLRKDWIKPPLPKLQPEPEPDPKPIHPWIPPAEIQGPEPPQRHLDFVGRKQDIEDLKQKLNANTVITVYGMPFIGKSWLVLEVVNDLYHAKIFDGVAWINCEIYTSHTEYVRQIALLLIGNRLEDESIEQCERRVLHYLKEHKNLVVLDNLDSSFSEDLISWLKLVLHPSCVVITARMRLKNLPYLQILELNDIDAAKLFVQRAEKGFEQDQWVREICRNIGNHPLMIEIIASRAKELPPKQLIKIAKEHRLSGEDVEKRWSESLSSSYQKLAEQSKIALTLLSVLPGTLDTDIIEEILEEYWSDAATELVRASMWRLTNDGYVVHPLVRKFALGQLGDQRRAEVQKQIAYTMTQLAKKHSKYIQPDEHHSQQEMRTALDWFEGQWPNLRIIAQYIQQSDDVKTTLCDLSDTILQFMIRRGHWKECEEIYMQSLKARQLLKDSAGEAKTLNDLGVALQFQNKWEEAISRFEKSIELQREVGISEQTPKTLNSLGFCYSQLKRFEAAEKAFQEGVKLCKTGPQGNMLPGKKKEMEKRMAVELGPTYSNLGKLYTEIYKDFMQNGELDKAEQQFRKAEAEFLTSVEIQKQHFDDARLGQTLNRQGQLYLLQRSWGKAIEIFWQSKQKLETIGDDFELGITYQGLGIALHEQRESWKESEKAYLDSIRHFNKVADFNKELEVYSRLAQLYEENGEQEKADQTQKTIEDLARMMD